MWFAAMPRRDSGGASPFLGAPMQLGGNPRTNPEHSAVPGIQNLAQTQSKFLEKTLQERCAIQDRVELCLDSDLDAVSQ